MKMNNINIVKFYFLLILLLVSSIVFAQGKQQGDKRSEKIEALRIAFLTERLELTPEEAEKFWPVYREFSEKQKAIRKSRNKDFKTIDEMSEEEANQYANENREIERKENALRDEYYVKFRKILPAKKVVKLQEADKEFRRRLLERMQKQKEGRSPQQREENRPRKQF